MKKASGHFLFILSLLPILAVLSCATNKSLQKPLTQNRWLKIQNAEWAEYSFYEDKSFPLRYHCVKIDLTSENILISTYPNSENDFIQKNGKRTEFFRGMTAKEFAQKSKSVISVNTAPFDGMYKSKKISLLSSTRRICGIHVVEKNLISSPIKKYSALCLKKASSGYTGRILTNQTGENLSEYDYVFGGFFTILKDFKKQPFSETRDSRTAVGLTKDGKTLYLLIAEGEKPAQSVGLSYPECAEIFLALGVCDAMQMDGGSSSSLFINGKNALQYKNHIKSAVFLGFKNK